MLTIAESRTRTIAAAFPADRGLPEKLRFVSRYAESAPELFGSRPWTIRVSETGIDLLAKQDGRLRKVDLDGRESLIAAGAAVLFLRLALRCHLLDPRIELGRRTSEPNLLARLTIVGRADPSPIELELFSLLTGDSGEADPVPLLDSLASDLRELTAAAIAESTVLRQVESRDLREMTASMLQDGDRLYYQVSNDRDTFRRWLGVRAPEPVQVQASADGFLTWDVQEADVRAIRDRRSVDLDEPAIAVICTRYDDERSWLEAGCALGRIQLLARTLGIRVAIFNQPLQVPGMRARFARESGFSSFPQFVIALGYASETAGRSDRQAA